MIDINSSKHITSLLINDKKPLRFVACVQKWFSFQKRRSPQLLKIQNPNLSHSFRFIKYLYQCETI